MTAEESQFNPSGQETGETGSNGGTGDKTNANSENTNFTTENGVPLDEDDVPPSGTNGNRAVHGGWVLAGTYLIGWLIFLVIFKVVYTRYHRQKQNGKKKWYPQHPEKEAYEELVAKGEENEDLLRKALLRRAMTDIRRVWELQEEKESLHKLTRSGVIPESMWNSYKDADHDMQLEIYDLQAEAETFKPGWSQTILKESAQLIQRERELKVLHAQINQEAQARAADTTRSSQEKKAHKKELMKAQALAEKMINKKYNLATTSMDSLLSDDNEKEKAQESSEDDSSEKL
jgi:hypothetical protein